MQIEIVTKHMDLDNPLRTFVRQKLADVDRMAGKKITRVRVELGRTSRHHRTGDVYFAEAHVVLNRATLTASAEHSDLRAAIVDVKDELKRQIHKAKGKREATRRKSVPAAGGPRRRTMKE